MFATLLLGLSLLGQNSAGRNRFPDFKGDFEPPPVTLHRSIRLEVIDEEIRRQHGVVLDKKALLDAVQRLFRRGAINSPELKQAVAEYRFHKALEAERIAYRIMEVYERDAVDW